MKIKPFWLIKNMCSEHACRHGETSGCNRFQSATDQCASPTCSVQTDFGCIFDSTAPSNFSCCLPATCMHTSGGSGGSPSSEPLSSAPSVSDPLRLLRTSCATAVATASTSCAGAGIRRMPRWRMSEACSTRTEATHASISSCPAGVVSGSMLRRSMHDASRARDSRKCFLPARSVPCTAHTVEHSVTGTHQCCTARNTRGLLGLFVGCLREQSQTSGIVEHWYTSLQYEFLWSDLEVYNGLNSATQGRICAGLLEFEPLYMEMSL